MNFQTFASSSDEVLQARVIGFTLNKETSSSFKKEDNELEYPLLFFSMLHAKMKYRQQLIVVDIAQAEPGVLHTQLSMSFLGQTALYWLKSFHELDAKQKKYWMTFLESYEGPHQICFFADSLEWKDDTKKVIELPRLIDVAMYQHLISFFKPKLSSSISKKIFAQSPVIPLDTACLLLSYHEVMGAGADEFIADWMPQLVVSDTSLFTLSQHFFAKNKTAFFDAWKMVSTQYGEPFWISFWSEQIWRAYYFIQFQKNKDIVNSKKMSFRLPFSFIQRDWRKIALDELRIAHQALYNFDFEFKQGASTISLELIFHQFMTDQLKENK